MVRQVNIVGPQRYLDPFLLFSLTYFNQALWSNGSADFNISCRKVSLLSFYFPCDMNQWAHRSPQTSQKQNPSEKQSNKSVANLFLSYNSCDQTVLVIQLNANSANHFSSGGLSHV